KVDRLEQIINRWGHILRVKKEDLHSATNWFDKYGYWTVLFCRLIPIVRSLISIPAGMSRMKFSLFLLFTMIGTVIWNTILVSIGSFLGVSWRDILSFIHIYSLLVYFLFAIGLIFMILLFIQRRKEKR